MTHCRQHDAGHPLRQTVQDFEASASALAQFGVVEADRWCGEGEKFKLEGALGCNCSHSIRDCILKNHGCDFCRVSLAKADDPNELVMFAAMQGIDVAVEPVKEEGYARERRMFA